jgi:hypothetical protein
MQITVEESKEADTTTKEATHRISRGIHDKVDRLPFDMFIDQGKNRSYRKSFMHTGS